MHLAQRALYTLIPLLLGLAPGIADPVQQQDIGAASPWAAHIDLAKLDDSPLSSLLLEIAGFDRIIQLQNVLKEQLAIGAGCCSPLNSWRREPLKDRTRLPMVG